MRVLLLLACALCSCSAPMAAPATSAPPATPDRPPSATPRPTAAASATPAPVAGPTHAEGDSGYVVELPPPWRLASCGGGEFQGLDGHYTRDLYTATAEYDEAGSDTGIHFSHVEVYMQPNPDGLTPRQWVDAGRTPLDGEPLAPVRFAGRDAVAASDITVVGDGARMFTIRIRRGPEPTTAQGEFERIRDSFRFMTEAERAAATPAPSPEARSLDATLDAMARGFANQDVELLASVAGPCMTSAAFQGGVAFMSRPKYLDTIRSGFAGGLSVQLGTSVSEQFGSGAQTRNAQIEAEWRDPGVATRPRGLMLDARAGRWEWVGTIELALPGQP